MTSKRRALFLDRDGVINVDRGYVYRTDQFEFVDGIFDLCRAATELGYLIFVVTNQAGIGRGYYTEEQFNQLTAWMCQEFLTKGAKIEHVYYCPFHPEHGLAHYKKESIFRKPGPGMIQQAEREFKLNLALSVLVGDKETDLEAGEAAGVGCNILYRPNETTQIRSSTAIVMGNLLDVRNYFCQSQLGPSAIRGGYEKPNG